MKKLIFGAIALALSTTFVSCDEVKDEIPDITININKPIETIVNIPANKDSTLKGSVSFDFTDNKTLVDNLDKLKKFRHIKHYTYSRKTARSGWHRLYT